MDGQYAGQSGTVTAVSDAGVRIYFDEWTEPTLAAAAVHIRRRGRSAEFGRPDAGTDVDYEEARSRIRQIPPSDLM